jgi:hypothetical protein
MNLGITPSLHYVRTYSTVLKQVVREVLPVNGQPEKHRWWLKPTKQQEEDIAMDKQKKDVILVRATNVLVMNVHVNVMKK